MLAQSSSCVLSAIRRGEEARVLSEPSKVSDEIRRGVLLTGPLALAGVCASALPAISATLTQSANSGVESAIKTAAEALGTLSYGGVAYYLHKQIRRIHELGEMPSNLSLRKLAFNGGRYMLWTMWACAQNPIQLTFLATRGVGAVLSGVLMTQSLKAKMSPLEYLGVGVGTAAVVGGVGALLHPFSSPQLGTGIEILASSSLLAVAFSGGVDQVKKLRNEGTHNVEKGLIVSLALNYTFWSLFCALEGKPLASTSFGLAALSSWACVANFFKRINPKAG